MSHKEVVECLERLGKELGFEVAHDPQKGSRIFEDKVELGRVDVVWFKNISIGKIIKAKIIVAAFEIHPPKTKSNKEIKGDLLNLFWSNAPLQVYVVPLKYLQNNAPKGWKQWYKRAFKNAVMTYARTLGLRNFKLIDYEDLKFL